MCLAVLGGAGLISVASGALLLLPVIYLGCGVAMSRTVSRTVTWNEHLASLSDIARVKRSIWLGWLISIPLLIWDFFVAERL